MPVPALATNFLAAATGAAATGFANNGPAPQPFKLG
jgi:hypothetical protein